MSISAAGARYVPNSTELSDQGIAAAGEPTLLPAENELVWSVTDITPGIAYTLDFQAKPGLSIGTQSATAKIATAAVGTVTAPSPASTAITEPGEPLNGTPAEAQSVEEDTLYLGYTSSGSDKDFFEVTAAPGEQLTIHLSHLKVDDDLVIYGPTIAPLRTPHPGAIQPVAGDVSFELEQRTQAITPEALTDVPQTALGQPVLDVSDNRGLADEEVAVVSPEGGTYTIQVSSFDGGFSNDPWMLRVEKAPAIHAPSYVHQPTNRSDRRGRDEADAGRPGNCQHALPLRLEALRRSPRGRRRERQSGRVCRRSPPAATPPAAP